jgi:hypothetical protein
MEAQFTMNNEELIEQQMIDLAGSIIKTKKIKCLRCGKCCVVLDWNSGIWENCKNLRTIGTSGKTFCRFYHKRIGLNVGYGFRCGYRKDYPWDVPGCPYNTGKPIHPAYLNSEQ